MIFLNDGFLAGSAAKTVSASFRALPSAEALADVKVAALSKDNLEVVLYRDYSLDDGRFANNGWLQEFPDPITKITWDNAVLVSRKTAVELGVKNSDVVEITLGGRTVKGPIWIQPGMADYSLAWRSVTAARRLAASASARVLTLTPLTSAACCWRTIQPAVCFLREEVTSFPEVTPNYPGRARSPGGR